jgi:DNA-binding transcriptional MerR regulator
MVLYTKSMDACSDILTTADVANLLSLSPERVRQLSRAGALNPRRTPHGTRIFSRADVLALKAKREEVAARAR